MLQPDLFFSTLNVIINVQRHLESVMSYRKKPDCFPVALLIGLTRKTVFLI